MEKRAIEIVGTLEPHEQHKAGRMALDQLKTEFEAELTKENNIYQDEGGNFISPTSYNKQEVAENTKAVNAAISKENQFI